MRESELRRVRLSWPVSLDGAVAETNRSSQEVKRRKAARWGSAGGEALLEQQRGSSSHKQCRPRQRSSRRSGWQAKDGDGGRLSP